MTDDRQVRVLVCGGRDYNNAANVADALNAYAPTVVIEGGAQGADRLAMVWAERNGVECITEPANWAKHGKAAGPIRNRKMLTEHKPDVVLWFPGGRGTADMKRAAEAAGVRLVEGEWAAKQWRSYAIDAVLLWEQDAKRFNKETP